MSKHNKTDLTGQKFGTLLVVKKLTPEERAALGKNAPKTYYLCKCDCGNESYVTQSCLLSGRSTSCGAPCHRKGKFRSSVPTVDENGKEIRIHRIWEGIKSRCNPNYGSKRYGKRGITICEEWDKSFEAFYLWAMENNYNDTLTIERIDIDGSYCPENCKWIPLEEQCKNKTTSHRLTFNGETHLLEEWSKIIGIPSSTLEYRLKHNWSIEETLTKRPNHVPRNPKYEAFGVKDSIDNLIKQFSPEGLTRNTVYARFVRWNDLEKALTMPLRPKKIKQEVK